LTILDIEVLALSSTNQQHTGLSANVYMFV